MSNSAYYLLWLGAGLVIIAIASAIIAWQLRRRVMRRLEAVTLLEALDRYSEWMALQQHALVAEADESGTALQQVRALSRQFFPEVLAEADEMLEVHARLLAFLERQRVLRLHDPEAWLESDHEARFNDLWRQHLRAVCAVTEKLALVSGAQDSGHARGTTFPA